MDTIKRFKYVIYPHSPDEEISFRLVDGKIIEDKDNARIKVPDSTARYDTPAVQRSYKQVGSCSATAGNGETQDKVGTREKD
jgi:hypothetical protein